jgi:hypothetical protein
MYRRCKHSFPTIEGHCFLRGPCKVVMQKGSVEKNWVGFRDASLSIYLSMALVDLGRFLSILIYTDSVRLPGREIIRPQGSCLYTEQHKHRINARRHLCLEWDSNPRSQCSTGRKRFTPRLRGHYDRHFILVKFKYYLITLPLYSCK